MPSPSADPARAFARRMRAIAIVVGMGIVALALLGSAAAFERARGEAAAGEAERLAAVLVLRAVRQPTLWRYAVGKAVRESSDHVAVFDCGTEALWTKGLGADARGGRWATIETPSGVVGHVYASARLEGAPPIRSAALIGLALALLVGGLVYAVATREVRHQSRRAGDALRQLESARASLEATNAALEARVAAAREQTRDLSARLVDAQQEERARIARDLHDSVGQHLSAQRVMLEQITESEDHPLISLHGRLMEDLRRAIDDLRPIDLETLGLEAAIRARAEDLELRTGVPVAVRFESASLVEAARADAALRIVLEALHNIERHARASEAAIRVRDEQGALVLEIEDDGVGGAAREERSAGHGLRSMRDRVAFWGGRFDIHSPPGAGTRIVAQLPPDRTAS